MIRSEHTIIDAYLDIETTGLSCHYADITVIGIYLVNGSESRLVQLVGREVLWTTFSKV